jgi:hypothetical protein
MTMEVNDWSGLAKTHNINECLRKNRNDISDEIRAVGVSDFFTSSSRSARCL